MWLCRVVVLCLFCLFNYTMPLCPNICRDTRNVVAGVSAMAHCIPAESQKARDVRETVFWRFALGPS